MAENSGISWTDHTFNPWLGCTNVGPGCDHCYAEKLVTQRLGVGWGPGAARRRTSPGNWTKVRRWNKKADDFKARNGHYPRVFSASLADIFDNEVDPAWRADFWKLVKETPKLQWLIVTKRIGNAAKMLPPDWDTGYPNVCILITVVNQAEADRDIIKLLKTPARWRGLSIEPMLDRIDLHRLERKPDQFDNWTSGRGEIKRYLYSALSGQEGLELSNGKCWWEGEASLPVIDWVITGGESAQLPGSRGLVTLEAAWIRAIDRQCESAGVPHHFKQWGYSIPWGQVMNKPDLGQTVILSATTVIWTEEMGRALDGTERNGFLPALEV